MPDYQSVNNWWWNCGKNDVDMRAVWGDNGELTIQVPNLRGITWIMQAWNERDDEWIHKSNTNMLPGPTSDPVTFHGVAHVAYFWTNNSIWGKKWKIYSTLTRVDGCFTRDDPNYEDYYQCGDPPHDPCV